MNKVKKSISISEFEGCQLPCVPSFATGNADYPGQPILLSLKRSLAYPWNTYVKKLLKRFYYRSAPSLQESVRRETVKSFTHAAPLKQGDLVKVRSKEEIMNTLDPFNELKGCAFLAEMHQYCGTEQRVFKSMERFMDERDYKVKKTRGLILLENVFCSGTPVFGKCDRSCFLFWREEWLEKREI
jgi:hypothetical protein